MPSSPQIQTVSFNKYKKMVEEYNDRTAKYNDDMNAYSEESGLESFTERPYLPEVSEFATHTWGLPLARAKSTTTGWVTLLSNGAMIEEGSEITSTMQRMIYRI